ncbi:MAG: DoxX family protein [Bacteroidia bacterium]|nr:DoxX family protein [Bacteroidia bacterium]
MLKWILRLAAAIILFQTLFFKFTGAPESVYIFTTLGIEPYGRIGSGIGELIAGILLLIPRFTWLGALMGLAVMSGAIFSHLTKLGIVVMDDGGQLFVMALIVFLVCAVLLWMDRKEIPFIQRWIQGE